MRCSYFLWRFGQLSTLWLIIERFIGWGIFLLWLGYVFIEKGFSSHFERGSITLVDLLLGIPIIIAMGLVFAIIWKGLIRGMLCVMGKFVVNEDAQ